MADEGFKFQLSSKIGDHMLNVRADSADEFRQNIDDLFGDGASVNVLTPFFVSGTLNAPAAPVAQQAGGVVVPVTTTYAQPPAATTVGSGKCPACGEGDLVVKNRKDNKGKFLGCNRFPKCNYIAPGKVA